MATAQNDVIDVVVIGGGWSGLLSCKHAKEEGLSVKVLEKREDLGGVWKYSDRSDITTVMRNTSTSSSSTVTEISDYPMPDDIGEFPKHADVLTYLESYADTFDLRRHIKFDSAVSMVTKQGNVWQVITDDGEILYCRNVVVCSGVHQKPNVELKDTTLRRYTGEVVHAGKLKFFDPAHEGKRIMIIGGGETASDILQEYHSNVSKIIWCIPRGQHFFRKYAKILPHRKPQALDKASSRALTLISPQVKSKPGKI